MLNASKLLHLSRLSLSGCSFCARNRLFSNQSNGAVDVAYYQYEKDHDPHSTNPIIIHHGMMGSKTNWQSLAKSFGKDGRKVIALDARNHGESAHVEDMDYFLMRDDILRLMDRLQIEQAVLMGHSMGGKACMTTALTHPERVLGLVVVDVSPTSSPNSNHIPAFLEAMLRISLVFLEGGSDIPVSKARRMVLNGLKDVVQDEKIRQFLTANLIWKNNRYQWRLNLDAIINNFPQLASFPKFEGKSYEGSTLFVGGSRSDYITEGHRRLIKSLFPHADIQHIDQAGHWVHADRPYQFLDVVNAFLNEASL